ncbi:MAG: LysR family transcriptional regulator [Alphaproteobacteria bacterium]
MTNIRNVDLNLLIVLDVLLAERNVSRAAERLNLSQPAVSGALKRLRTSFRDPLFVRAQQGIRPTPFALGLIAPLKSVLQDIDTIFAATDFVPETAENTFTIAASDYAQMTFLAPLMSRVNRTAPNIRFSVVSTDVRRMPEQLDRQEIDFAVTVPEMSPPDAQFATLFEDRYVCALSSNHPLANRKLTLDRFCELDHVLVTPSSDGFYGPTDEALAVLGRERHVAVTVPNFLSLPSILKDSDFITVAPERVLRPFEDELCIFPAPLRLSRFRVIGVWHELSDRSPAHVWLRDLMTEVGAGMT